MAQTMSHYSEWVSSDYALWRWSAETSYCWWWHS